MLEANVKIIEELKQFLFQVSNTPELLSLFKNQPRDFTRIRKLPFDQLVLLITKLCKKTLSVELDAFFEEINSSTSYSVSAFSQQRLKLNFSFFHCWNEVLHRSFYQYYGQEAKRWKGYRVIAADGSTVNLVNKPGLKKYFGGQTNQYGAYTLANAFFCHDVLNDLTVFARLAQYRYSELNMAYDRISQLEADMLMIYDRNFCNYKMAALHQLQEREIKFVIRAKESQRIIKAFIKSRKRTQEVWLTPSNDAIEGMYKSQFIVTRDTRIRVRLVRVKLKKRIEVLMTNLWEEEGYATDEFKALYFLRWGIETSIGFKKNIMQLEAFSGLTSTAVLQDFYATLLLSNLHTLLIKTAQQTIEETTTHRKHAMKVNNNKAFGKLKAVLIPLFLAQEPISILEQLHRYIIRDPLPIRPGRSYPRVRININSKNKHKTFANYKSAY